MTRATHRLMALLVLAGLLLGARPAWAQDAALAIVERIHEVDPTGRYRSVDTSTRASRTRGDAMLPLDIGMDLEIGDIIEVDAAQVQLRYPSGERLLLGERSRVVLSGERSLSQSLGEVYYRLKDAFRVQYGTVETVVEGTRFVVIGPQGDGPIRVRVDEGRVRVSNPDTSVTVDRGEQVSMPSVGSAAVAPERARLGRPEAWRAFSGGRPRLIFQGLATGSALIPLGEGTPSVDSLVGSGGVRLSAGVALGRLFRLTTATAIGLNGAQRLRLPQELSLGVALPGVPLAFGGGPELTWERCIKECGGRYKALHLGGTGWVQGTLSLGPRFGLVGEARVSAGDVIRGSGGVGVEVSL
jgi:hypothetical protein